MRSSWHAAPAIVVLTIAASCRAALIAAGASRLLVAQERNQAVESSMATINVDNSPTVQQTGP